MQNKTKIFLWLAVALSVVLALVFLLKAPSRESYVEEAPQAADNFAVNSLAAFNLSHVKYIETVAKNRVAACISRRYKITSDAARKITQLAEQVAGKHDLDPNLILAIIANESKFHPLLVSPVGALGLMQIMPNVHKRKLAAYGGENAALNPEVNMMIGAGIISSFIRQTGSLDGGLAMYVGAGFHTSHPYVYKVKYELDVFRDCANGIIRNTPDPSVSRAVKSIASEPEGSPPVDAVDAEK
jgi:soluble lytic murein transglycosylase-like protein